MSGSGKNNQAGKGGFWNFIDRIEGDKVVWIIVFMLTMISALAIFSSTSLLTDAKSDRIDLIREHSLFILIGYIIIFALYRIKSIGWFRILSKLGFAVSLVLLALLASRHDFGFIKAQYINGAWRTLSVFGFPIGSIIFGVADEATPFFHGIKKETSSLYPVTLLSTKKTIERIMIDVSFIFY